MKSFCQDASTTAKPGEFWGKIIPLSITTKDTVQQEQGIRSYRENEKVITDPKEIAETFNNYFAMVNHMQWWR